MIRQWRSHLHYQSNLLSQLSVIARSDPDLLQYHESEINALYWLDLDPVGDLVASRYSVTGAPARLQVELFRSFLLMSRCRVFSIPAWVRKLAASPLLRALAGYLPGEKIHQVGSYYDLVNRIWCADRAVEHDFEHSLHPTSRKPSKKYGKNQKQPVRRPGVVQKLVELALQDRTFENRPELLMQQIFAKVGVEPAAAQGLLGQTSQLTVAGDGTCIHSGASPMGNKQCSCKQTGVYNCQCPRIYADPYARFGWDSYHDRYYYGHTAYLLSVRNANLQCDLPVYLRLIQSGRHDSVSAVVALAEFRKLHPDWKINTFCGDAAHDALPIYRLLDKWDINAVIALNNRSKSQSAPKLDYKINMDGVPVCLAGIPMVNWGFNKQGMRRKFRCPLACGKIKTCDCQLQCPSDSDYGRSVYVSLQQDLRLCTRIQRGSTEWKRIMKSRTSSERVNKRILNDYALELYRARGKKRIFWWTMVHSVNILLDARLKAGLPSVLELLELKSAV